MKPLRLIRLALALAPLCLLALPQCAPAQAPGALVMRLPAGAPPPTAAQQQKYVALNTQFNQGIQALKNNRSLTPAQKVAKAQQMASDLNKNMLAMLTPAQRAVVLKDRNKITQLRQAFLKQHQAEIAQVSKLGRAYQKSFTTAQKQRIQAIGSQAQEQLMRLRNDPKTAPAAKQHTADAILRDTRNQEMAVLTPAQRSQMQQLQSMQARLRQELTTYAAANGQR